MRFSPGRGRVGKAGDILMLKSALDFIAEFPDLNLIRHTVEELRRGTIEDHYRELGHLVKYSVTIIA
jgi:hypothetical protein